MSLSTALRAAYEAAKKHGVDFSDIWKWVPTGDSLVNVPELNFAPGMPEVQAVRSIRKKGEEELKQIRLVIGAGEIITLVEGDRLGYSLSERKFWLVKGKNSHTHPLRRILAEFRLPQRLLVHSDETQQVDRGVHCWGSGEDFQWVPQLYDDGDDVRFSSWKVVGGKVLFFYTRPTYEWEPCRIEKIIIRSKVDVSELTSMFERTIRILRSEDEMTSVDVLLEYEDEQRQRSRDVAIRDFRAKKEAERERIRLELEAKRAEEARRKHQQRMLEFIVLSGDERITFRDGDVVYAMTPHKAGAKYAIFSRRNGSGLEESIERESIPEDVAQRWSQKIGFKG